MDRSAQAVASPATGSLRSTDESATRRIGQALGRAARPGSVLALSGPLGAGKTQLAKGVAAGLGVRSVVNSPTFILMNEHVGRLRLFHIDAYRLDDPEEALAAGLLDEREAGGVTVIEWADRLGAWLPAGRLDLALAFDEADPQIRHLAWRAHDAAHARLAREALGR
jgi:tRNA threonylcarbamoyladenosine biosynthesis protein TsaE